MILLFLKPDLHQAIIIKWIIKSFEIWSGLKVSCNKNYIIVREDYDIEMMIIEKIMDCIQGQFLITYLGMPMRETSLKKRFDGDDRKNSKET